MSIAGALEVSPERIRAILHPIKHGEIPAGNLQPYFDFSGDGRVLTIHTPFTPRPFDHTMSNRLGAHRERDQSRAPYDRQRQFATESPDSTGPTS